MLWFYSDNTGGCSPQIIEALQGACQGEVRPYGFDEYTQQLDCVFSQVFETKAWVVPVTSGIAANCIGLQAIAAPFSSIVCHEKAHVYAVERGAVEFYTQGARLVPLPGEQGCIDIDQLEKAVSADQAMPGHMPWSALTVTQLNDVGVAYSTDRLRALCDLAHSRGARVHMDGSRFANALACLGCSPADMSWKAGVDVLSFGATKNGTMLADAIVTFDEELCRHMRNNLRRMAQNPSKSRFLSVQLLACLKDGLWLRNARHANEMAARLSRGIVGSGRGRLLYPTHGNELFVAFSSGVLEGLKRQGIEVRVMNTLQSGEKECRLVAGCMTEPGQVDAFLEALQGLAEA